MNNTPQLENGYVEINNENAEQFAKLHLSGNEWQIIWVVLRKTWGWKKKEDSISLTQFEELTGLSRPSVKEAINKLVGKRVLLTNKDGYINKYSFNKLYNQWIVGKKVLVGFSVKDSTFFGKQIVPKKEHTKEIYTKETIQKKYTSIKSIDLCTMQEIADKYHVPLSFVQSKFDDMSNWLQAKGKSYRNYKAALCNWVKSDALKIMQHERQQVNKFKVTKL